MDHIDGLVEERRNSIANALELRLSCTNPSIFDVVTHLFYDEWHFSCDLYNIDGGDWDDDAQGHHEDNDDVVLAWTKGEALQCVIMSMMSSQTTGVSLVYSTVF